MCTALKATEQPIDTSTAAGKCFLDMLGVFAEFETNLRRERQLEGIAKAKAAGVYKGRKPNIDPNEVRRSPAQARRLGHREGDPLWTISLTGARPATRSGSSSACPAKRSRRSPPSATQPALIQINFSIW
jgi:DNA invertase Pin-like site-specific DNA recombinase